MVVFWKDARLKCSVLLFGKTQYSVLLSVCWHAGVCAHLMKKGEVRGKLRWGWPPSGTYGKGCRAGNSSRHVGVFNGEWSNLCFLMMIRGGNWLRFTVSLTIETEEGENRIKASKLSDTCVCACICASVHRCETERGPVTYGWLPSQHPSTHTAPHLHFQRKCIT